MQINKILNKITFTGFYPPYITKTKSVSTQDPDLDKLDEELKCYKQPVKDEFIKTMLPTNNPQDDISFGK